MAPAVLVWSIAFGALAMAGCGEAKGDETADPAVKAPLLIGQENVLKVTRDTIIAGPDCVR